MPNIARNAIINCGELVTYDLIKDALLRAQLMTGEDGTEGTALCAIPIPIALTPHPAPQTTSPVTSWPLSGLDSAPQWWRHRWTW